MAGQKTGFEWIVRNAASQLRKNPHTSAPEKFQITGS